MRYKAVIFDVSGTLAHCKPEYRYDVVGNTYRQLGLVYTDADVDRFWFGHERSKFIETRFKIAADDFWAVFRKLDDPVKRGNHIVAYQDVGVIDKIKRLGILTGIVTGSPPHIFDIEISCVGKEKFDYMVCANRVTEIPRKPNPAALLLCAKHLGVEPAEAIYVGNAEEDVMAARNAGMTDVFVDRKEYNFPGLKATYMITDLNDIMRILR